MANAVESAKKALTATSGDEDAFMLAELIHNLGLQAKSVRYSQIANGKKSDARFEQTIQPNGNKPVTVYALDPQGSAKTPDDEPCRTIEEQIAALQKHQEELAVQADEDGVRRMVEDKLRDIQISALERMEKAATEQPDE